MRAARKFQRLGRDRQGGQAGKASVLDWLFELFRSIYARGARGNLLPAPPAPARVEASTQLSTSDRLRDEEVAKLRAEVDDLRFRQAVDDLRLGTITPPPESGRSSPPSLAVVAEDASIPTTPTRRPAAIPTATPTDDLAAESISLAVWALDASKAVETEPATVIPERQLHRSGARRLFLAPVFVGAFCATFLHSPRCPRSSRRWRAGRGSRSAESAERHAMPSSSSPSSAVLLFVLVLHLDDDGRRCTH